MIDIHSHLIHGVDDGPATIKESIRMVLEAEKLGIKVIIATPHMYKGFYKMEKACANFMELKKRTIGCGVELYIGCEAFIDPFTAVDVNSGSIPTLNNSKYLLFELPFDSVPLFGYEIMYKLQLDNFIPIIAHPERNRVFNSDFGAFVSFIEKGCLVQLDAASITGIYGREAKKFARKLIKHSLVDFVASDAHCSEDYKNWYIPAYNEVTRLKSMNYADNLFLENGKMILEGSFEKGQDCEIT